MSSSVKYGLTIGQKVLLGIFVGVFGFSLLGAVSYNYLIRIEHALRLAEIVDDLSNDILEVRRYEKNYMLYGQDDDLLENLRYVQQGLERINRVTNATSAISGESSSSEGFDLLRAFLMRYRLIVRELATDKPDKLKTGAVRSRLREQGKVMVETSQRIVAEQREGILVIVNNLKRQLLLSIVAGLILALAFYWLVGHGIIRALRLIGKSTAQIAQGNFTPLPEPDTLDETADVARAFNRMIVELRKRQNQLLQEKKLASLGVLTSGIAHQLNNPLNNISTSCQILREEGQSLSDDFARELLSNIYHEVLRSRDIVKGLLEFSRVTEFSLKPVSLHDVVERSFRFVSSQLPAGVEIIRRIPEDLLVPMDVQRMQEVFLNLFINAMQAIKEYPGTITVEARREDSGGFAEISVSDTGVGIPQEYLGRIFDPFFTLKEVGKGTGLGLSIVFGIIRKHGGTITAESEAGRGTVFTIRLPLNQSNAGEERI